MGNSPHIKITGKPNPTVRTVHVDDLRQPDGSIRIGDDNTSGADITVVDNDGKPITGGDFFIG